ncbi:MAG TPA: hypothetical protein VFX92_05520 [Candidatus Krumholzibacteria bacterium]|nr:hypothetical protein [Candidatus Krumholzibacteria bacterium]
MSCRWRPAIWIAGFTVMLTGVVHAQTLSNPDLSAIGDMRVIARGPEAADSAGTGQLAFSFEELEIALNAYLNPYMRADVFMGFSDSGVEIEEANFTVLRGLPFSMQFNAGKYLLDFGRINSQHPHQWSWIERPLMSRAMLGPEGLRAIGVRASVFAAVGDNAVTLTGSAFGSDAFAPEDAPEATAPEKIMGNGRLSVFRQIGDYWSAEVGGSYLAGEYAPSGALSLSMGAVDMKVKWRPNAYQAFVWVAEIDTGHRDIVSADSLATTTRVEATGAFTSAEMVWRKRFDAGAFFDWTQSPVVPDAETTAVGGFFGFMPVEETARFTLVYRHETSDLYAYADNSLTLQFLWSMGPHKTHTF